MLKGLLPNCRLGVPSMVVRAIRLKQPGIDNGKVRWHDGEKQQKNTDYLRYMEGVTGVQEVRQDCQANHSYTDDGPRQCLCPRLLIMGKHLEDHLESFGKCCDYLILLGVVGSTCYQYGSVGRSEAVVYIYNSNVGGT